ncbi:MAG: hypothetical protein HYX80_09205 [Chloroflexi bacterium]|nr:hypothetical protein [Chloroflexota bacterium]
MPYVAKLEKAGIPTVVVNYADQDELVRQTALASGLPNVRLVHCSRTLGGPEDVDAFIGPLVDALTRPLTKKEKESGKWAPPQERVLFEGSLDEAETFYQQTRQIHSPLLNAPIAVYTDGLPVRIPTEERVREMLTGTSHKPDEVISYPRDIGGLRGGMRKKGDPVRFQPMGWTATVEKVAIIAVMAGCKPEYLPVVLAIAQSECPTGTAGAWSQWSCVSGPIAKEIGMNFETAMLEPGNPPNATIGRAYQLMAINLGGAVTGVNRLNNFGSPFNTGGVCFAENADGLPSGWKGLNEEYGFKKNESIVMVMNQSGVLRTGNFPPGGYRALQKSGHGGIARRLGVKGVPGLHNFLEYLVPDIWTDHDGGFTFLIIPQMARDLYDYGFKSKNDLYEWLYKKSFEPLAKYRLRAGPDLTTNGWMGIERTSGKPWKELPDDYMVPVVGEPHDNCIIVCGGTTEHMEMLAGRRGGLSPHAVYNIDAWR